MLIGIVVVCIVLIGLLIHGNVKAEERFNEHIKKMEAEEKKEEKGEHSQSH